jgi:hypothetical protein
MYTHVNKIKKSTNDTTEESEDIQIIKIRYVK